MCYKDELQRKNAEKLNRKFEEDNVPNFIRNYFCNLNSEAGKLNYYSIIMHMLSWMLIKGRIKKDSIGNITPSDLVGLSKIDIIMYLDSLLTAKNSPSTINTKKHVLSAFWTHLVDEGIVSKNIIRSVPKTKYKLKKKNNAKIPRLEDMESMVNKMLQKRDRFIRERNLIVFRVLKGTGLREAELAGLDLEDLHIDASTKNPYVTVMGKGVYFLADAEKVFLSRDAKMAIKEWLKIRCNMNIVDEKAVFINKNGKRLSEDNIKLIFKNYSDGKITPHMMRHFYATDLYQRSGHDAAFVQEQLRHSDVNTTLGTYVAGDNYKVLEKM